MVKFEEALDIILRSAHPLEVEKVDLQIAEGRILAEDVRADMNMPPFNKSAVDGYACRREDLSNILEVIDILPAGKNPTKKIGKNQCMKIMTGGIVPEGADTVIMVEETEIVDQGHIRFKGIDTSSNICLMGEDVKEGSVVLRIGTLIRPQEVSVLAMFGYHQPNVYCQPRIGILTTGDELVEPDKTPSIAQIRNTNASQLIAQLSRLKLPAEYYGIVKDQPDDLKKVLLKAFEKNHVIIITGGVSAGEYDYVPEVLKDIGVSILFKNIAIQPGRPTLFGTSGQKYLFGLPGNPVSSFIQFELLIKPFLYHLMGHSFNPPTYSLSMAATYQRKKANRKSIIPVRIESGHVFLLEYHGSAHISAFCHANGFVILHEGQYELKKGEFVDVRLL